MRSGFVTMIIFY